MQRPVQNILLEIDGNIEYYFEKTLIQLIKAVQVP